MITPGRSGQPRGLLDGYLTEVEGVLSGSQAATGLREQHCQFRFPSGCAHMLEDHITAAASFGYLDFRAARPARGLPHEHHDPTIPTPRVCHSAKARAADRPP